MKKSGRDTNRNGILDEDEITDIIGTFYTNGTPITLDKLKEMIASNEDVTGINTCTITDMGGLFNNNTTFNQDIGNWNTSNVTNIKSIFNRAGPFNQDIASWDTSNVKYMSFMFHAATNFNQDISQWDITSVEKSTSFHLNSGLDEAHLPSFNH